MGMKTPEEIKKGLECCKPLWKSDHWKTCDQKCPYTAEGSFCKNILNSDALALIQQLEAQVPKWISVEDRLPETFESVIVLAKHEMLICHHDGDEWVINYDGEYAGYDYEITHWMPLPESPKED